MVKKIIILILWVNISFAISSLELAKNLVNNPNKNSQLELLFSNNSYIDNNGNCDIAKISQILKTNPNITEAKANELAYKMIKELNKKVSSMVADFENGEGDFMACYFESIEKQ